MATLFFLYTYVSSETGIIVIIGIGDLQSSTVILNVKWQIKFSHYQHVLCSACT